MRSIIGMFLAVGVLVGGAWAGVPGGGELGSVDAVNRWISNYRVKPQPARLAAAVRALSQLGALKETEASGVYVGFIAGVIYANPARAEELIAKLLPIAAVDQWVIVRAIAYSGHPEWKELLGKFAGRMPQRRVMAEKYIEGKLPIFDQIALEKKSPTLWQKLTFSSPAAQPGETTFDRNPELLDTLWGYYFATGSYGPIARIVVLLPWSNDRDSVDKLTVGNMAKYTLASNASRDPELLALLKAASKNQPRNVAPVLAEVIDAAESMETTRLRKDALAALEELKRKGPAYKRDVSTWGQIGTGALALGCIAAAATGHIELGLPCVIGGAGSSAALSFWDKQQ
jgi:hypothetical protein